jgi:beta-galactosidase GanA
VCYHPALIIKSVYFFWAYHSPARDVFDFENSGKNIQRMFDYAKEAGLYVIVRPGPYCNAQANGGGFALWTSDGSGGEYRTSDEQYHQAWLPYYQTVGSIIAKNQVTRGGPVIIWQVENELQETVHEPNNTLVLYMEQLENATRDAGIVIPLSHNEKGESFHSWSTDYQNVGGAVNLYGLDSYPDGTACTEAQSGFNVVRNYYSWFQNYSFTQPEFLPEFQAGRTQPWGGFNYDECLGRLDPAFADVFYKNNVAQVSVWRTIFESKSFHPSALCLSKTGRETRIFNGREHHQVVASKITEENTHYCILY